MNNVIGKFRWVYLPVMVVLGLIWYEFWRFNMAGDAPGPATQATAAPASAPVAAAAPADSAPQGPAARVAVEVEVSRPAQTPVAAPVAEVARFSADLPPLTVKGSGLTLDQVVAALNTALGPQSTLTAGTGPQGRFTLDAKDKPFWEIFRDLSAQNSLECVTGSQTLRQNGAALITTNQGGNTAGLQLSAGGQGFHRFEIGGPAILVGNFITMNRTTGARGAATLGPRHSLSLTAAVDPRIHLAGPMQITGGIITDDAGRTLEAASSTTNSSFPYSNAALQTVSWTSPDDQARKVSLKCELHFSAMLTEASATLENAAGKADAPMALGPRAFRATVNEMAADRLQVRVQPDGGPGGIAVSWEMFDSAGTRVGVSARYVASSLNNITAPTAVITLPANAAGPFRLVLHGPGETRDFAVPFNLRDLLLP